MKISYFFPNLTKCDKGGTYSSDFFNTQVHHLISLISSKALAVQMCQMRRKQIGYEVFVQHNMGNWRRRINKK